MIKKETAAFFIFYFLFLTALGFIHNHDKVLIGRCDQGSGTKTCLVAKVDILFQSLDELAETPLQSDYVSYALMAKAWLGKAQFDEGMAWRFKNWPPLIPLLTAGLSWFESIIPIGVGKLILISLLLSYLLTSLMAKKRVLRLLPCLIFLFPNIQDLFFGQGLWTSEAFGLTFFLLGLMKFFSMVQLINLKVANRKIYFESIGSGLFFGLGGLSRAQVDMMTLFCFGCLVLVFLLVAFLEYVNHSRTILPSIWVKSVFALLIVSQFVVLPWKMRNFVYTGMFTLCATQGSIYDYMWLSSEKLPYWIVAGNTPCQLAGEKFCSLVQSSGDSQLKAQLARALMIKDPIGWLKTRTRSWEAFLKPTHFPNFAVPDLSPEFVPKVYDNSRLIKLAYDFEFTVLIMLFLLTPWFFFRYYGFGHAFFVAVVFVGIFSLMNFVQFLYILPETRYFAYFRLFGVVPGLLFIQNTFSRKSVVT